MRHPGGKILLGLAVLASSPDPAVAGPRELGHPVRLD